MSMIPVFQSFKSVGRPIFDYNLDFALDPIRYLAGLLNRRDLIIVKDYGRLDLLGVKSDTFVEDVQMAMTVCQFPLSSMHTLHIGN